MGRWPCTTVRNADPMPVYGISICPWCLQQYRAARSYRVTVTCRGGADARDGEGVQRWASACARPARSWTLPPTSAHGGGRERMQPLQTVEMLFLAGGEERRSDALWSGWAGGRAGEGGGRRGEGERRLPSHLSPSTVPDSTSLSLHPGADMLASPRSKCSRQSHRRYPKSLALAGISGSSGCTVQTFDAVRDRLGQ